MSRVHDPLCPLAGLDDQDCFDFEAGTRLCDLIARARADERVKVARDAVALVLADHSTTPTLGVRKAIRHIEALTEAPAGPAEGTGSAGAREAS